MNGHYIHSSEITTSQSEITLTSHQGRLQYTTPRLSAHPEQNSTHTHNNQHDTVRCPFHRENKPKLYFSNWSEYW